MLIVMHLQACAQIYDLADMLHDEMYVSGHILSVATWDILRPRPTENRPCPEQCDEESLNLRDFRSSGFINCYFQIGFIITNLVEDSDIFNTALEADGSSYYHQ